MGLTTALNTSLNGLSLNETAIEVLGNNIANAGTNGFKSSSVHFTTQLARTLSVGSAPQGPNGGTNPRQIGLGATTASIARDLSQGAISGSTSPSDIAIEGAGYFVLAGNQGRVYSRNGNFSVNTESKLINDGGLRVQGYGIDDSFNLVTTQLVDLTIPLGNLNVALETTDVELKGALKSGVDADVATLGGVLQSDIFNDSTTSAAMTSTSLLKDLIPASGGSAIFRSGETLSFTPRKGGADYDTQEFSITDTTTVGDLTTFLRDTLGIVNNASVTPDATYGAPGVSVTSDGRFRVVSNRGTSQAVAVFGARLQQSQTTIGGNGTNPVQLNMTDVQQGNGESVVVTFPVYDSLGEQVVIRMHAILEDRSNTAATYRYYFESSDDSDLAISLTSGTFSLDGEGKITGDFNADVTVNRQNTAAQDMSLNIDFSQINGLTQPGADGSLNLLAQNGAPPGTLGSFNINETGVISGVFTNGVIRTLGQLVMAQFPNPLGLVENGGGSYLEGISSGPAQLVTPGAQGSGTVRAGAIELSNTDVGRNLVDLIVASTNYRGNARVITSVQQLVDELLVLGR